jgi:uncharacterized membrane protein
MKKSLDIIKTTLKGGILFLVPFAVTVYIFALVFSKLKQMLEALSARFQLQPVVGEHMHWGIILIVLIFICFLIGLLAKTKTAKKIINGIEDAILGNIPGYSMLKTASESILNVNANSAIKVVLLDSGDSKQIAFLVNVIDENHVALFVPDTPNPTGGGLVFVKKEMVKELDISYKAAIDILKSVGTISSKHLAGKLN